LSTLPSRLTLFVLMRSLPLAPNPMFNMRPSIRVSQDATERLQILYRKYTLWYAWCYNYTNMGSKPVHNCRQPRTLFEETK
jgi:hypothetical protein